jgi:hypothetical protein
MRKSSALCGLLVLASGLWAPPGRAGDLQVIDDFETGVGRWYLVEGARPQGFSDALCVMTATADAKFGRGAARLRYAPCPGTWTHMQLNIRTADWIAADCDRIGFWLKGDGSGETLQVMFGNYERRPPLCFRHSVRLDFTGWREFVVPFSQFEPRGRMQKDLGDLVLVQLNVSGTRKPVDVTIDELVALPAERSGGPPRFFDLVIPTAGGWSDRGPTTPLAVDNLKGLAPGLTPSRMLHGIRNHPDLHNPVTFAVRYPDDGTFGVRVGETSGYGGSRLVVRVDGKEKLRRDFPGQTQTALSQYQGHYAVPIPAGRHRITVDNDGADWMCIESYSLGNFQFSGATVRRADGRIEATIRDAAGDPLADVAVGGDLAGTPLDFRRRADGVFLSEPIAGRFPTGVYPAEITARRGGEVIYSAVRPVRIGARHLRPLKVVYPAGQDVDLVLRYGNEADAPLEGQALRLSFQGENISCDEREGGLYRAALGRLAPGAYRAKARLTAARTVEVPFLVRDPAARPWEAPGLVGLGRNGWLRTSDGRAFVPWGFATIGLFAPDAENAAGLAGPSAWCRAADEDVLNWIGLLASYGVNCVRFGVTVDAHNIGGDTGGHADPFIIGRLRRYLDLIGPLGVRAIPVLWWGHYRNFGFEGVPAYEALVKKQADWFTNPQALRLHEQYVREVVAPFRNDPRILAWEVMNETYRAGDDLGAAVRWTNEIARTIRAASPRHLITTSAAEATPGPELQWIRAAEVDFFNYHEYPTYPDYDAYRKIAGDSPREIGNYAAVITLCNRLEPKVSLLGETGNDRQAEADYPELRALITRDCLWLSFLHGSPGGISWDAIADPREFYVLSRIAGRIDGTRLRRAPAPLAVAVSDADGQLTHLARYTWWSLRHGVGVQFVPPEATPAVGQVLLPGKRFAPPAAPPAPAVSVSEGFQAASAAFGGGEVFLAYVRNLARVPRVNTRVRSPRPLSITVAPPLPGRIEIWDLDARQIVRQVETGRSVRIELGQTAHDYALFRAPAR